MKTRTIGEVLREAREHHHISISDLARLTRIKASYLEALETNSFTALPAAAFVKGYIKTYAQVFGLDYQPLLALLRRDYKASAKGRLVPREFIKPVLRSRSLETPVTLLVVALAVSFGTLISYVGFQWYRLQQPPPLSISQPEENQTVSSQVIVAGRTVEDGTVTVNAEPVAVKSDGSFEAELFLPREGLTTITVEATDRRGKSRLELLSVRVEK